MVQDGSWGLTGLSYFSQSHLELANRWLRDLYLEGRLVSVVFDDVVVHVDEDAE